MALENVSEYTESTQKDLELLMLNSFLTRTMDVFLVQLATSLYQTIRLTVAETETDNKCTELNGNLCCYLSLQNEHLHTIP